jgi:hypothetical protein
VSRMWGETGLKPQFGSFFPSSSNSSWFHRASCTLHGGAQGAQAHLSSVAWLEDGSGAVTAGKDGHMKVRGPPMGPAGLPGALHAAGAGIRKLPLGHAYICLALPGAAGPTHPLPSRPTLPSPPGRSGASPSSQPPGGEAVPQGPRAVRRSRSRRAQPHSRSCVALRLWRYRQRHPQLWGLACMRSQPLVGSAAMAGRGGEVGQVAARRLVYRPWALGLLPLPLPLTTYPPAHQPPTPQLTIYPFNP